MKPCLLVFLLLLALVGAVEEEFPQDSFLVQISAQPTLEDEYCSTHQAPPKFARKRRVIGFEPQPGWAAHHMILFTCEDNSRVPESSSANACKAGNARESTVCGEIQFAWAHGGGALFFPAHVGLYIGPQTTFALQVHYGYPTAGWTDRSGVKLFLAEVEEPESKIVWREPKVLFLGPRRFPALQPGRAVEEITGRETVPRDMLVFAIRVHAHTRGIYNAVQVPQRNWSYNRSTQLAQSFVPLSRPIQLWRGDALEFKCVYDMTLETRQIKQGFTKRDEMCNVYLMFYERDVCAKTISALPALSPRQFVGVDVDTYHGQGIGYGFHRASRAWTDKSFDEKSNIFNLQEGAIEEDVIVSFDLAAPQLALAQFGAGQFYMPHAIRVDPYQRGIVWLADVGSHTVSEFDLVENRIVRFAGRKMDPGHLCMPTDIALSETEVFISDGYCHSRIAVFDRADLTRVKREIVLLADGDSFYVPHAMVLYDKMLLVVDRENGRVLAFNALTGERLSEISSFGLGNRGDYLPYSIAMLTGYENRLVVGLVRRFGQNEREGKLWLSDAEDWSQGQILPIASKCLPHLKEPHMLAYDGGSTLYVAEAVDGGVEGGLFALGL